jgi:uncharacterized protein (TIGR03437 family)
MKNLTLCLSALFSVLLSSPAAFAQKTTSISLLNIGGPEASVIVGRAVSLSGTGNVSPFGNAAVSFNGSRDQVSTVLIQGSFIFSFNRLDSFSVSVTPQAVSKTTTLTSPGTITGGTGIYSGARGSIAYTFHYAGVTSSAGTFTLFGSGTITIGTTTTAISLANFSGPASITGMVSGALTTTPTGSVSPLGNVTLNFTGIKGSNSRLQGTLTFVFNATDSFSASYSFVFSIFASSVSLPCTITGGTGIFRGATGSIAANVTLNPDSTFTLTGSGTITQPAAGTPIINSISTAFGFPTIAQNTWIQIQGTNLVPGNTPPGGVFWNNAPEFSAGRMPTQLGGISVTVNGKPAYVWGFCSGATSPCAGDHIDQINVLSPLDSTLGQVQVVATNQAVSSAPMSVDLLSIAPAIPLFDVTGHVIATHTDFTDIGPVNLIPGLSTTPARPLEVVLIYAFGLGLPTAPLVDGSATQSGSLPVLPTCQMAGAPAPVVAAVLVSPGLYALGVTVPAGAPNGDNVISCSYLDAATPAGNLVTVQR